MLRIFHDYCTGGSDKSWKARDSVCFMALDIICNLYVISSMLLIDKTILIHKVSFHQGFYGLTYYNRVHS
jgi:hypothetical protein